MTKQQFKTIIFILHATITYAFFFLIIIQQKISSWTILHDIYLLPPRGLILLHLYLIKLYHI